MRHCFVIMSFSKNSKLKDAYKQIIKPTVEKYKIKCERVDEQHFNGSIKSRIVKNIKDAIFIIADLTEARPNCYYELGYAHALKRDVIHLCDKSRKEDIHFDVADFNFILYSDLTSLKTLLDKRIAKTLKDIKSRNKPVLWAIPSSMSMALEDERIIESAIDGLKLTPWYLDKDKEPQLRDKNFSAVLYSYDVSGKIDNKTALLIDQLNKHLPGIRLIIYSRGNIQGKEHQMITTYRNFRISNMPSTLKDLLTKQIMV